ncbi:DUF5052 family protein [Terrilactibacillus sp. S3-3]|nr:DUF5052 family protein [Terrilactibacillus sp. S3-3]
MKKALKYLFIPGILASLLVGLSGCQIWDMFTKQVVSNLNGLNVTMQTYDADGQPIDTIHGISGSIKRDRQFDQTNEKGETTKQSSVLNITIAATRLSMSAAHWSCTKRVCRM